MRRRTFAESVVVMLTALACFALLPGTASAQSALTGVVRDTTGAVMPGVTVEAASPVLIEKVRTVVSDERGVYRIVDLRQGTYTVTFTLPGFSTVRREGLELPANFTATVNADMRIGALEETVTVSGAAPVVDVSSIVKSQTLNRDVMDGVPTGRTYQGMAQLIVGITMSRPDVGGAEGMQQTTASVHGASSREVSLQIDGMVMNGMLGDGGTQGYFNDGLAQGIVYQTSGANADLSQGGVRVNMIPREGGNEFSGSLFMGYQDGAWQSDNFTQDLKDRGLRAIGKVDKIRDFNLGLGGRIFRNKLWYFGSFRHFTVNKPVADVFWPDGRQGIDDNGLIMGMVRLTWQISPNNKFAAYNDRTKKSRGHTMSAGDDPGTASRYWASPMYQFTSGKWTSTATNRLLIEGGYSGTILDFNQLYQKGIEQPYGTPGWYATASRVDLSNVTRTTAATQESGNYSGRYTLQGSVSYVTGSHNMKFGFQHGWGPHEQWIYANADLYQNYQGGVPFSVSALNTPVRWKDSANAISGIYGQDQWTFKRLTLNYGLRWEVLSERINAQPAQVGRFTSFPANDDIQMPTWRSFNPRFGLAYDVFGNAKTALKLGLNRYDSQGATGFAIEYDQHYQAAPVSLSWTDLNEDDIAQGERGCVYRTPGCEINFAQLPQNFGISALNHFDPNIKRPYSVESSVGIQHELRSGFSVSGSWFHRDQHNRAMRNNTLNTAADYTPVDVVSPMDGKVITMYNISRSAISQVSYLDSTNPGFKQWYNGFEFSADARLPNGGKIFGGTSTERTLSVTCDAPWNPNLLLYCDQRESGIPWRTQFKLAGSYPLKWGLQFGASLQMLPGYLVGTEAQTGNTPGAVTVTQTVTPAGLGAYWLVTPTTRYAADCTGPCTPGALVIPNMGAASLSVPLLPPATQYLERLNQLDLSVSKRIRFGQVSFDPKVDVFNVTNASPASAIRGASYGTSSYLQPSVVLLGRIVRLAAVLSW